MSKNKLKNILSNIIIIFIILIMASILIPKFTQNDIFFDLKTGQDLFKYGLDFKDHFSFIPNLTYLYHHYLYDILIYQIYSYTNFYGIFIFFLLIYSLLGFIVYKITYNYSQNKLLSLFISLITMYLLRPYYTDRVQTITYILFFLEVYYLTKLYNTGNKKYSFILILLSILIVNLHMPLWLFTLVLCLPFLAEIVLIPLINKIKFFKNHLSPKIIFTKPQNSKIFILTFILLLLSGLCSPFKLNPYTFFIKAFNNSSYSFIMEMKPTVLIHEPKLLIILGLTIILFMLKTKIKFSDLALLLGLFVFSLIAHRNISYVYLFYPLILIKIFFENYSLPKFNFLKLKNITKYLNINALYFITAICLLICYISSFSLYKDFDYKVKDTYPDEIVDYVKNNLDYSHLKFYCDFNYGSYLALYDIPIFIDSRAEVYIKEFNGGEDIIKDYLTSTGMNYKKIFEKYQFDYAVVYYNNDLYHYLEQDADFELLYNEDNMYVLFKKVYN